MIEALSENDKRFTIATLWKELILEQQGEGDFSWFEASYDECFPPKPNFVNEKNGL